MKREIVLSIIICVLLAFTGVSGCSATGETEGFQTVSETSEHEPAEVPSEAVTKSPKEDPEDVQVTEPDIVSEDNPEEVFEEMPEPFSEESPEDEPSGLKDDEAADLSEEVFDTEPSAMPAPEPHILSYSDDIETIIGTMTLHEKICQMIIVTPAVLTHSTRVTSSEYMPAALSEYPVGGMIFDKSNIVSGQQLRMMISGAQSCMTIPMIMTLDEEGGRVSRLMGTVGTTPVGAMYLYHELGPDIAAFNACTIGNDIRSFGFNMDLAPVADVWSNPANTVIGDRAYSTDFDEAAVLVSAAVSGFHTSGVACCIKHFPGHGDTSADSHYGSVYIYKTLDELRGNEFKPFISGISARADAVMIGHLIVKDQGDVPAVFSYPLLTGVLRNELGFGGVIMSDSLQMKAMTDYYGVSDIPVMAVSAGCDMLLMPTDLELTVKSLEDAVGNGIISEDRIDESVRRILTLKKRYISGL